MAAPSKLSQAQWRFAGLAHRDGNEQGSQVESENGQILAAPTRTSRWGVVPGLADQIASKRALLEAMPSRTVEGGGSPRLDSTTTQALTGSIEPEGPLQMGQRCARRHTNPGDEDPRSRAGEGRGSWSTPLPYAARAPRPRTGPKWMRREFDAACNSLFQ